MYALAIMVIDRSYVFLPNAPFNINSAATLGEDLSKLDVIDNTLTKS